MGSRYGSKETTNGLSFLDVNWLNTNGRLTPGRSSAISWSRGDQDAGRIMVRAEAGRLILEYRTRSGGEDWESVVEPIQLTWTPCNYGGHRPWFICPGVRSGMPCRRRVGKLYLAGRYFLCRHCYGLAYESQRDDESNRMLTKMRRIRKRLGGSSDICTRLPPKPKGMHWRTYRSLRLACREAEWRREWTLAATFAKVAKRYDPQWQSGSRLGPRRCSRRTGNYQRKNRERLQRRVTR